jgi:hypothetical protein
MKAKPPLNKRRHACERSPRCDGETNLLVWPLREAHCSLDVAGGAQSELVMWTRTRRAQTASRVHDSHAVAKHHIDRESA